MPSAPTEVLMDLLDVECSQNSGAPLTAQVWLSPEQAENLASRLVRVAHLAREVNTVTLETVTATPLPKDVNR